jgi:hypothetical protein
MTAEIVKFPYNACRRVHARKDLASKNVTPEERVTLRGGHDDPDGRSAGDQGHGS